MTILVIENNPISRKLARTALEAEGYSVLEAADGREGLALMAKNMPALVLQDFGIAVNISARDLLDTSFPDFVDSICRATGTLHHNLTLELTERDLMTDPAKAETAFHRLNEMDIHFSIDDFGTGYSALAYLQKLSVDEIKIDKSFVAGLLTDLRSAAIVRSIIDLGRNLGVSVVAEGVEDQRVWEHLAELGCDIAQGYRVCRPLPPHELISWVGESSRSAKQNEFPHGHAQ